MSTPISVLITRAEKQIELYTEKCMKDNNIPEDIVVFALKAVLAKLEFNQCALYGENLLEATLELQKLKKEKEEKEKEKEDDNAKQA